MAYEPNSPIALAKDILIALIDKNPIYTYSDKEPQQGAKAAAESYKIILKGIMQAANDPDLTK